MYKIYNITKKSFSQEETEDGYEDIERYDLEDAERMLNRVKEISQLNPKNKNDKFEIMISNDKNHKHHIWCNWNLNKPAENCLICKILHKEYPEIDNLSSEELDVYYTKFMESKMSK